MNSMNFWQFFSLLTICFSGSIMAMDPETRAFFDKKGSNIPVRQLETLLYAQDCNAEFVTELRKARIRLYEEYQNLPMQMLAPGNIASLEQYRAEAEEAKKNEDNKDYMLIILDGIEQTLNEQTCLKNRFRLVNADRIFLDNFLRGQEGVNANGKTRLENIIKQY